MDVSSPCGSVMWSNTAAAALAKNNDELHVHGLCCPCRGFAGSTSLIR